MSGTAAAAANSMSVNSTEASQLILTDRGLPSSPKVREAFTSLLAPADQESASFVDRISQIDSPVTAPAQWIQEMKAPMAAGAQ